MQRQGASPARIDSGLAGVRLMMTRCARALQRTNWPASAGRRQQARSRGPPPGSRRSASLRIVAAQGVTNTTTSPVPAASRRVVARARPFVAWISSATLGSFGSRRPKTTSCPAALQPRARTPPTFPAPMIAIRCEEARPVRPRKRRLPHFASALRGAVAGLCSTATRTPSVSPSGGLTTSRSLPTSPETISTDCPRSRPS
jgi:hypothetical protein